MLLRSLHDLDQTPALLLGERPAFHDLHEIADVALVLLVVRLEAFRLADDLLVHGMRNARLGDDDDRLLHLVGRDATDLDLAPAALCSRLSVRLRHACPPPSASRRSPSRSARSRDGSPAPY